MALRKLWKDQDSKSGGCPALYIDDKTGDYIVQGTRLDPATTTELDDLADNETAVRVPANVLDRLGK